MSTPFERLDPTLDVVFKLLLSSSEELLISLLTAVLRPKVPIRRAVVQNPELIKGYPDDKGGFLDVLVFLDDGARVNVEMQTSATRGFRERALYYWSGVFSSQLTAGRPHHDLARVVSVLFLDYQQFSFPNFHEVFRLRGDATGAPFSPLLEIHTIELPKLDRLRALEDSERALVRWCRFLSSKNPQELETLAHEDPLIELAELRLAELAANPRLRQIMAEKHRREMGYLITMNAERKAAREEGHAEGHAEGERTLVRRLLVGKFGPLPERAEARLLSATEAELTLFADRILSAKALDDVLR